MATAIRKTILRADSIFLIVAGGGFAADLLSTYFGAGDVALALVQAPLSAVGALGAYPIAVIFGVLLWRAEPVRAWHLTAVAIHGLLGTFNLVFWPTFAAADRLAVGCITTTLHGIFVALQLSASHAAAARASRPV